MHSHDLAIGDRKQNDRDSEGHDDQGFEKILHGTLSRTLSDAALFRSEIKPLPHFLASFKHGYNFFGDWHMLARAWIASDAGIALLHRKCTKPADLNPVTACERLRDLVENGVHHILGVPLVQLWILIGNFLNQLGFNHAPPVDR
jgi:hypothetical protein